MSNFVDGGCSVARALERLGERWTLLILRDAFHGVRRFDDFQADLGVASNVLADRLAKLVGAGILEKHRSIDDRRCFDYRLTAKGRDLYPVLVALAVWGDRWEGDPRGPRLRLVERESGRPVPPIALRAADGRTLRPQDVVPVAGPGAGADTRRLLAFSNRADGLSE